MFYLLYDYLSMVGSKLNHIDKRGPWRSLHYSLFCCNSDFVWRWITGRLYFCQNLILKEEWVPWSSGHRHCYYNDFIMGKMASQITNLTIAFSTIYPKRISKKISKLQVTGLCAGNSPVTGEFPSQRASNVENLSIQWCHHGYANRLQRGPLGDAVWIHQFTLSHSGLHDCVNIRLTKNNMISSPSWNGFHPLK